MRLVIGAGLAGQGLAHRARAQVPDQHPAVVGRCRKRAAIGAERQCRAPDPRAGPPASGARPCGDRGWRRCRPQPPRAALRPSGERPRGGPADRDPPPHAQRRRVDHVRGVAPGEEQAVAPRGNRRRRARRPPADANAASQGPAGARVIPSQVRREPPSARPAGRSRRRSARRRRSGHRRPRANPEGSRKGPTSISRTTFLVATSTSFTLWASCASPTRPATASSLPSGEKSRPRPHG